MRKLMSLMLLAVTASAFVPTAAEARTVCQRVWMHGRLVTRCHHVPPHHHHHYRRPPPPPHHHGPGPYHR
ncbi:hypothetical protein SAMN05443245_0274 [Paraburkholderia fungorum]|uniref:Uncharacterized protein n=1 Tax=Paraburkholderia fungorum TaxID=134537 RepID=A0A1H0YTK8_9BURK|nr:hypothetical protein SAMN05443245_0274 [Paraburkholderia fungorum]